MQGVYIVFVALLATVSANNLQGISDQIKQLLENFKTNMNQSQFGLPPLDPLNITHLSLDIDSSVATLKGSLDNFLMTNLSSFVVNDVKLNILLLTLSFNISLPSIDFSGDYDLSGSLGGGLLSIYGKGPFEVDAEKLWVSGSIKLGSNNTFLYIKTVTLDYNLPYVNFNITGLFGGGELSEVINQVLTEFVPEAASNYKPQITTTLSEFILTFINKKLDHVTLQDILDLINGKKTTTTVAPTTAA